MFKNFDKIGKKGITLTETIVVIAILIILALTAIPAIYHFQDRASLDSDTSGLVSALRLAKTRTTSSQGDSQWGVYLDIAVNPEEYVLFKGVNYAGRDVGFDEKSQLSSEVELFNINLAGAAQEIVFKKVTGNTVQYGDFSLRLKDTPTVQRTIYVDESGRISLSTAAVDDTGRLKDSRRVHFDYARIINTATESISLSFDGGSVVNTIPIITNMSGGQIFWSDEVVVGASTQVLTLHTLRLNDALDGTLFCVHRGLNNNDVSLDIDISGDLAATPDLIHYFADGATQQGNSLEVSAPIWR